MDRLQKILARGGIASRRAAERLIAEGRVRVNGRVVTEPGEKADPRRDRVEVDGKRVVAEQPIYIVLHKPRGVVSTMSDPEGRPTVRELLAAVGGRVFPIGRLDFATSGVLLASNDGAFADGLLHPRREVPKTYVVKVKGVMQPEDLEAWRRGVELEDGKTLPAEARMLRHEDGKTWFELTIREGRNQQIRRMGETTGFPVMRLARLRFADVSIEGLAPGRYRHLSKDELVSLKKAYGVPRSIPAAMATAAAGAETRRGSGAGRPQPRKGAQGRGARSFGRDADDERMIAAASDTRGGSRPGAGARGGDKSPARGRREAPPRGAGPGRRDEAAPRGRRDEAAPRGRRDEAAPRGRRDEAAPRGRRDDARPSAGRRDEAAPRGRGRDAVGPPPARGRAAGAETRRERPAGPPKGGRGPASRGESSARGPKRRGSR